MILEDNQDIIKLIEYLGAKIVSFREKYPNSESFKEIISTYIILLCRG